MFMEDTGVYINKLSEELRLRKYPGQTEKAYVSIIKNFLESGLDIKKLANLL